MKALRSFVFALLGFAIGVQVQAQPIIVHDPVMIRENNTYYIFCTGWGISVFSSTDMKNWKNEKPVFAIAPQWAVDAIPGFKGHIWAPDIAYFNDEYYLYYSVSAFGKNTSCIGLATNKTLNPSDPDFHWVDHGKVIQSIPGKTNWNAIDPNLALDSDGTPYLVFGSFWDGIKLVKLSSDAKSVAEDINRIPTIASRKSDPNAANPPSVDNNPVDAGGNAIEAPFIFRKGKFYYLFASIDYCCKGVNSSYKMIVGRAKKVTGPYIDQSGKSMATGGGSLLLQGDANWYGVGHNAVVSFDGTDYLVFHGYDAQDEGKPKLNIRKLDWNKDQWPVVK
ncbi:MAG TPA: arabinan endo-1,5-alpha-L-arabinosidase [Prolixibacteraceae bacterium]|jgi:arabinan endo-1,5-alpha-L-arabinosidase|nr:arabinan endo-1,5-alpha-L-arabinosidase [Prolixibacteraceae bacterium]